MANNNSHNNNHNRNVSGGSLLWRQDAMRNDIGAMGLMSEFSPFAPVKTNDSAGDRDNL